MADEFFCPSCKRELTGALEVVTSDIPPHTFLVSVETNDCNWRLCNGCFRVRCKSCDDASRNYCCDEGYIAVHERAAALAASARSNTGTNSTTQ